VITSFDVTKIGSAAWSISMTPSHCGTNIDMIKIVDALRVDNNTSHDVITYRPDNQTSRSLIAVTRDQKATPPIGGTFELTYEGRRLTGE